jgi:hypothetical protein
LSSRMRWIIGEPVAPTTSAGLGWKRQLFTNMRDMLKIVASETS